MSKIHRVHVLAAVGLLLLPAALYLRTGPARAERALQNATYAQLQDRVRQDPGNPRVFYYFGLRLHALGHDGTARLALARAAQLDPDAQDICLARAALDDQTGDSREAFQALSDFARRHPRVPDVHWALAFFFQNHNAPLQSYQEAMVVAKLRPGDAKAWRLAGAQALKSSQDAEAVAALSLATALDPRDWRGFLGLGDALHDQRRDRDAADAYRKAVALAPGQPLALTGLGQSLLAVASTPAQIQEATGFLSQAAQITPDSAAAQGGLGEAWMRLGRWPQARTALQIAERVEPAQPEVHLDLIRVDQHLGDAAGVTRETSLLAAAQTYLRDRSRLLSTLHEVHYDPQTGLKLARLCASHGDFAEAGNQYQRLLAEPAYADTARREWAALSQAQPQRATAGESLPVVQAAAIGTQSPTALLRDGDALLAQGDDAGAERAFRAVLAQNADSAPGLQGLGLALNAQGRTDEAFALLNHALKLDPSLNRAGFAVAQIYFGAGFPDEARRRLLSLVQAEPDHADYWSALGDCYALNPEDFRKAEDAYRHADALAPHVPHTLVSLAQMEASNLEWASAEGHYRQALQLVPGDPIVMTSLAKFLLFQPTPARRQEAEALLQKALHIRPDYPKALLIAGSLRLQRGDAAGAVPLLEAALTRASDQREGWYDLGRAYDRLGKPDRAAYCRTTFQRLLAYATDRDNTEDSVRLHPKDAALRLKMARYYAQDGQSAKAINQYQVCLALDPKNAPARKELGALVGHLQASGQMPSMAAFDALLHGSVKKL